MGAKAHKILAPLVRGGEDGVVHVMGDGLHQVWCCRYDDECGDQVPQLC